MARSLSSRSEEFAARVDASGDLAASELLEVCTEELELKALVLDGLADGILVHTTDGEILYFNQAAATLYGYSQTDFAELGNWEWVPLDRRESIVERITAVLACGHLEFESCGLNPDGTTVATEVHARLLELPQIGTVIVSVIQDITERVAAQEMIEHLAFHDTLTGLANRVLFDERLKMAAASADRHGDILGLVYMDLDDFKPVNDSHGHSAGDFVLKIVAGRLTESVREYDTVARIGGDEFLILFPRLKSEDELSFLGQKILDHIAAPIDLGGLRVKITATLGLATYRTGEAPDELISRADHAMYEARGHGAGAWWLPDPV